MQSESSPSGPTTPELPSPGAPLAISAATAPAESIVTRPGRPHLVVVVTRPVTQEDRLPEGAVLVTRFWHPRDRRWSENYFDSLDHALRLFVDESGWLLRQQQPLDADNAWELIFEARREDFANLTTTELLEVVGLSKERVEKLVTEADRAANSKGL
jgi:hypothetical protein